MALSMGISQPKYSRIEKGEAACTMQDLQDIANILETDISAFWDMPKITIQNQSNNDYANGYVENLHIENKEAQNKLIQTLEDNIQQLKDDNQHLKKQIEFLQSNIKS
jgi:transcriptional regulator with XRE-family HTH domain